MKFEELLEQELKQLDKAEWLGNIYDPTGKLSNGYRTAELRATGRDRLESYWRAKIAQVEEIVYRNSTGELSRQETVSQLARLGFKMDLRQRDSNPVVEDIRTGRLFYIKV